MKLGKDYHADHIVPVKLGGASIRQNLQITCARCNLSKNARDPLAYARSLGLLL
jgi:5-methylcytosine-specific restriction endonuclease McrA